jgi:hypothetical protein
MRLTSMDLVGYTGFWHWPTPADTSSGPPMTLPDGLGVITDHSSLWRNLQFLCR